MISLHFRITTSILAALRSNLKSTKHWRDWRVKNQGKALNTKPVDFLPFFINNALMCNSFVS